ncbi:MAG: hypothetical protein ACR2PR_07080 [Pseudohongiellaceae bacterium]
MQPSQQSHKGKNETRHNEGFKAARNLESTGIPRDQAEAIVKTATSEAILIVNTHALSKEDFRQEMKDFRQELDARNYVTQEQLAVLTAQLDTKFANLKTQMAEMKTEMGQKITKASVWVVVILGGLTALLQGGLLVVLSQILDKL